MPQKLQHKFKLAALAAAISIPMLSGCVQSNSEAQAETVKTPVLQSQPHISQPIQATVAQLSEDYRTRPIQDEVMYFVFPDRFHNADESNDMGDPNKPESYGGFDRTSNMAFHGGDIKGLTEKLDYIEQMGVTSIWLTPILRNQATQGEITGYHGYWVLDFTEIDPHLGSNDDLKDFIAAAHDRNIKIFFDIITNHTADVIKYAECHGEDGALWSESDGTCDYISLEEKAAGKSYTTVFAEGTENLKVPAWLNDPKYYHNQGDSTWEGESAVYGDFVGLDDVDTDNPEVLAGMIDIFKNIVSEFKPDGFRVDTVKHVNIEFWQGFVPAIEAHAKEKGINDFFIFGEVFAADTDVLSYYTNEGTMRSVLDFGFQSAVYQTLVEEKGTDVLAELFGHDHKYRTDKSDETELVNFVSNHDVGRLAHSLRKADKFEEAEIVERNLLAQAMMYFLRGVPVVYYGDEQGFVGDGGNHDSRQDMMPSFVDSYNDDVLLATDKTTADDNFDQSHPYYIALTEYSKIYAQHKTLRHGSQEMVYSQNKPGVFAVKRVSEGESDYLVVINTANEQANAPLSSEFVNYDLVYATKAGEHKIAKGHEVTIAPLSLAIYKAK